MKNIIQIKKIQEGGDAWIDMADDEKNPCKTCGVCCTHFRISFYQGELKSNNGFVPDELVSPITPFLVAMKGTEQGGRCISLNGDIGVNISCNIYHNRPSSCRMFPVWLDDGTVNPKCQELREKNNLKPLKSNLNH
jgi:Fe-S-cluster containining protein